MSSASSKSANSTPQPESSITKNDWRLWLRQNWAYVLPFGFALLAGAMMVYDMHWGPWAFSDSAAYISAARNLVSGHGFSLPTPDGGYEPLNLHQPLYSLVMAFFLLFDIHPFTTTTVLNVACIGLTMFILGAGSYYLTKSKIITVALLAVLIVTPAWIDTFDGAMSEPLFVFLTLAALFVLLPYFKLKKTWMVILAGFLAGLSLLTRYIGIVTIGVSLILLLFFQTAKLRRKSIAVLVYGGVSSLPYLVWLLLVHQPAAAGRQILLPVDFSQRLGSFTKEFLTSAAAWPPSALLSTVFVSLIAIFVLAMTIFLIWRRINQPLIRQQPAMLPLASGLFCVLYSLFLFAAYAFSSIPPDINSRTLIPLLPFCWLMITSSLALLPAGKPVRWAGVTLLAAYSIYAVSIWLPVSHELLYDRHHNGLGYTSKYYQESTIREAARSLPLDIPWITNDPAFLLLYFNKFPYDLTTIYPLLSQPNPAPFGQGNTALDKIFKEDGAALLILQPQMENQLRKIVGDAAPEVISEFTAGLYKYADSFDGQVYFWEN